MKATLLLTLTAICLLNVGCTLGDNLLRTSVVQPIQYCNYWDKLLECHRFRKVAELELERVRSDARAESDNYACPPFSIDYERGFERGFIDYLMYGGNGNLPPLPPRRYWWSDCEKIDGSNAIQDWFQGFQHGVVVAKASGYRDCVTVPLGDLLIKETLPFYPQQFSETEQAEPLPAPNSELDAEPIDLPVAVQNMPAAPLSSNFIDSQLAPSFELSVNNSGTLNGSLPLNQSWPPAVETPVTAALPSAGTSLPFAPSERSVTSRMMSPPGPLPAGTPGMAWGPTVTQSPSPSTVIRDLPAPPLSPSVPALQLAPLQPSSVIRDLPAPPTSPSFPARR